MRNRQLSMNEERRVQAAALRLGGRQAPMSVSAMYTGIGPSARAYGWGMGATDLSAPGLVPIGAFPSRSTSFEGVDYSQHHPFLFQAQILLEGILVNPVSLSHFPDLR